ncbi:hypothetical protein RB195_019906 [Necator americanus]|uniref:Uncharacterized protein n=1 Tax=Necator americanus TaxID=51031 RepID=A0ABR1CGA8_NECAM
MVRSIPHKSPAKFTEQIVGVLPKSSLEIECEARVLSRVNPADKLDYQLHGFARSLKNTSSVSSYYNRVMLAWLSFVLLCSLISARELRYAGTSTLRDVRAIAPSYSSWCIFYPERCRLLNTAQGIAGYHESSV